MKISFLIIFFFYAVFAQAQGGYQPGNVVSNLSFTKVLNAPYTSSSLAQVKGKLTILDFFGTWCVPCIRALPKLTELQQANKNIKVILISVEEEAKLKSFLAKRSNLPFPIVVDQNEAITSLFQPPSLPYTVVLDENGKLLSVTEALEIDNEKLAAWLAGKSEEQKSPSLPIAKKETGTSSNNYNYMPSANSTVKLSQEFIYAAKTGEKAEAFVDQLKGLDYEKLKSTLKTDDEKKAFWINLYNGFTQYFLRQNPDQYKDRGKFFKAQQINVAGKKFSLDDIEHGILRRSKIKWSLGYLGKLFPGKTEKELRVADLDYRLHFALNCGAKSCPPIAFYAPEKLDAQLELATKSYLGSEVEVAEKENKVSLPAIMGWFRRDFGGKKGMRDLLRKHGYANVNSSTSLDFKKYDWNLYLDNYKNL